MKNAQYLLFVISLIAFGCSENVRIESTGKIKSMRTISYEAFEDDGVIKRLRKKGEQDYFDLDTYLEFDTSGNEILKIDYDSVGKIARRFITEFDGNGQEKKKTWYDSQGKIFLNHISEFDKTKNLTITRSFNSSNALQELKEMVSDESGNIIFLRTFDQNGSAFFSITSEYNENNQLVNETINWIADPDMPKQVYTYVYDKYGDQVEKISINGGVTLHDYLSYNEYGDPTKIVTYISMDQEEDQLIAKDKNEYTYDANGNWINCVKFQDETPTYIIDREISYYDNF